MINVLPVIDHPYGERQRQFAKLLLEAKLPAAVLTHLPNIRYLTGFTGSNGLLLLGEGVPLLFTDPRYDVQAREEAATVRVKVTKTALWKAVSAVAKSRKWKRIGAESSRLSHATWMELSLEASPLKLNPIDGLVERLRTVKSAPEIEAMRLSARTCGEAYESTVKRLKPGASENDVAAELEYQMRRRGAEGASFDTIVAAGARAALPHARPTAVKLEPNQLVLVDMGASRNGYASDMTRMFALGDPGSGPRRWHKAVLEAQLAALHAVRPGVTAGSVDRVARRVLKRWKLDGAFTHSTGHGLGLEIHEAPRLGRKDETVLEEGMVITIEPGVYLEGEGGVRIEDTVLVTATGADILTPVSKELLVI